MVGDIDVVWRVHYAQLYYVTAMMDLHMKESQYYATVLAFETAGCWYCRIVESLQAHIILTMSH